MTIAELENKINEINGLIAELKIPNDPYKKDLKDLRSACSLLLEEKLKEYNEKYAKYTGETDAVIAIGQEPKRGRPKKTKEED
jgi:hypothetical protein